MPPIPKALEKAALAVALVAIIVLMLLIFAGVVPFLAILHGLTNVGDKMIDRMQADARSKA